MGRTWIVLAVAALLAGCGADTAGAPAGDEEPRSTMSAGEIWSNQIAFDPDGLASGEFAALSEEPIVWRAFAGWYGGSATEPGEMGVPHVTRAGTTYLAVTAATMCRTPQDIEVTLDGTDLRVTFTGGENPPECVRPVGPTALIALLTDEVRDVRTVNGKPLVDAAGPGRLRDFVPVGVMPVGELSPAELSNSVDIDRMLSQLAPSDNWDALAAALKRPVADGHRGFAFVQMGCPDNHTAVLLNDHGLVTAQLLDMATQCANPNYSFLATFEINPNDVPNLHPTQ